MSFAITVKLTGTLHESVQMVYGHTGKTLVIESLPFVFSVSKSELPLRLSFKSDNYEYVNIDVPTKAVDEMGHIYLLKSTRKPNYNNSVMNSNVSIAGIGTETSAKPIPYAEIVTADNTGKNSFDLTSSINRAPLTGKKNPNTFAVIIANEEYDMASNVDMATNDGLAMKEYFSKTFGLSDNQILYYPNATYGRMNKAIHDLKNIADAFDGKINLIFYYAGHGIPDNETKDAYIMPVDVDGSDPSVCYSLKKLYSEIDAMKLNQAVVLLDACFSGSKRDGDMIVAARGVAIKPNEEKPQGNTIVLSATSGEETAFSYKDEKHGMFTYYLLKHIQENNGDVTIGSLSDYINTNVRRQSVLINGKKQTPTVSVPTSMENWRNINLSGR